jgi:beta-lactamase regulating signal transducer with metallopeptidase domain
VTNPEAIRVLGWCLLHFVWQGGALALVLYALLSRLRSPQARYLSAVCTLAAMMLVPLLTFAILDQPASFVSRLAGGEPGEIGNGLEAAQTIAAAPDARPLPPFVSHAVSIDWMSYAVVAWFAGVYMFTLRTLGGWMLLIRLRRQHAEPIAGDLLATCLALQRRLGVSRAVRYVCSKAAESPAVFGWWRPVVVLPLAALAGLSPWQVEAIIAHELAHIKRWDLLVNAFQIGAETLLFYHPAVWWVNRIIRNEREHCCDDVAVGACGNAHDYARALALLEESRAAPMWALAANGGVLTSRIGRLLGLKRAARTMSTAGLAVIGALCVAGILMAGTTVAQLQRPAPQVSPAPPAPLTPPIPLTPTAPMTSMAPYIHLNMQLARLGTADAAASRGSKDPDAPKTSEGSYIGGLQAAGLKDLKVNEIIALKIHGVTPDYIRGLRAAGIEASSAELVSLKIHEVTPEYVRGLTAAGLANLRVHDYLAARVQGITPEFVQKIRSHGFKDLTLHQLIALKMADIS